MTSVTDRCRVGRDEVILIDTHVAIWIATATGLIGPKSRALLEDAAARERLVVSAISFREIALLISKQRLRVDKSPAERACSSLTPG